jgi:hypothetical protein
MIGPAQGHQKAGLRPERGRPGRRMELLSPQEAAAAAGVLERTLRKWARAGLLNRHVGPDGRPGYARADIAGLAASPPVVETEGRPRAG